MNIYKLITASTWILPVITAVILHELAHGYAALRLGDDTALKQGRLSFNPLKHIDPLGTIILPLFLVIVNSPFIYGWAKPVPVSLLRLKKPKTSMAIVAAAGPLVNIFLAFSAVVLLKLASNFSLPDNELIGWVLINIRNAFIINLILAAFNLIPFPPLDGSKILAGFLPNKLAIKMILFERYGMIILFALLFLPSFIYDFIGIDINILGWYVSFVKRILAYFMFKTVNF